MVNDEEHDEHGGKRENKSPFVIQIPSYEEVLRTSQPQQAPPSLFTPSTSFSQAFSFVKNSEFYTPPPSVPPPTSSSTSSPASRPLDQSGNPSASAPALCSPASQNAYNRNAILVSHRQKGNPLLKHIRNVKWAFADIVCDYQLGQSACALYLSLRYHLLHPDYLYFRIRELQKNFKLRVVLCHVDVEDVIKPLLEVTKTAVLHDCTLLCGWSLEECGRYLETVKVYENKPADLIQGQTDTDYLSRINHALTSVRHVNKTDVVTLGSTFGSLSSIMDASMEDLARCPGIGEHKVKRLHDTFHEPFKRAVPKTLSVAQTSTQNNNVESSAVTTTQGKEGDDTAGREKIEPEAASIKSALSAAFAKYSEKIDKNNNKSRGKKIEEESSIDLEAKANDRNNSGEADLAKVT